MQQGAIASHDLLGDCHLPLEVRVVGRDPVPLHSFGKIKNIAVADMKSRQRFLRQNHPYGVSDLPNFQGNHGCLLCHNERYNSYHVTSVPARAPAQLEPSMMQESHAASSRDKYPAESSNYIEWGPSLQALLLGPFFLFYFPETALGPQTATGDPRGVAGEIRLGRGPPSRQRRPARCLWPPGPSLPQVP